MRQTTVRLPLLQAALLAALASAPGFAQAAAGDPPLTVVPPEMRLTLVGIFAHATPLVKLILAGLIVATLAAAVVWAMQLSAPRGQRSRSSVSALAYLTGLSGAGPLIGFVGAFYGLTNSFLGLSNVRPAPSLSVLAPGFAEAALAATLGLLAAAIAVIARRHLEARLEGPPLKTVERERAPQAAHAN